MGHAESVAGDNARDVVVSAADVVQSLCRALYRARDDRHINKSEFAERTGLTTGSVRRMEREGTALSHEVHTALRHHGLAFHVDGGPVSREEAFAVWRHDHRGGGEFFRLLSGEAPVAEGDDAFARMPHMASAFLGLGRRVSLRGDGREYLVYDPNDARATLGLPPEEDDTEIPILGGEVAAQHSDFEWVKGLLLNIPDEQHEVRAKFRDRHLAAVNDDSRRIGRAIQWRLGSMEPDRARATLVASGILANSLLDALQGDLSMTVLDRLFVALGMRFVNRPDDVSTTGDWARMIRRQTGLPREEVSARTGLSLDDLWLIQVNAARIGDVCKLIRSLRGCRALAIEFLADIPDPGGYAPSEEDATYGDVLRQRAQKQADGVSPQSQAIGAALRARIESIDPVHGVEVTYVRSGTTSTLIENACEGNVSLIVLAKLFDALVLKFRDQPTGTDMFAWLKQVRRSRYRSRSRFVREFGGNVDAIQYVELGRGRLVTFCRALEFLGMNQDIVESGPIVLTEAEQQRLSDCRARVSIDDAIAGRLDKPVTNKLAEGASEDSRRLGEVIFAAWKYLGVDVPALAQKINLNSRLLLDVRRGNFSLKVLNRIFAETGLTFYGQPTNLGVHAWLSSQPAWIKYGAVGLSRRSGASHQICYFIQNGRASVSGLCLVMDYLGKARDLTARIGDRRVEFSILDGRVWLDTHPDAVATAASVGDTPRMAEADDEVVEAAPAEMPSPVLTVSDRGYFFHNREHNLAERSPDAIALGAAVEAAWIAVGFTRQRVSATTRIRMEFIEDLAIGNASVKTLLKVFEKVKLRFVDQPPGQAVTEWLKDIRLVGQHGSRRDVAKELGTDRFEVQKVEIGNGRLTGLCQLLRHFDKSLDVVHDDRIGDFLATVTFASSSTREPPSTPASSDQPAAQDEPVTETPETDPDDKARILEVVGPLIADSLRDGDPEKRARFEQTFRDVFGTGIEAFDGASKPVIEETTEEPVARVDHGTSALDALGLIELPPEVTDSTFTKQRQRRLAEVTDDARNLGRAVQGMWEAKGFTGRDISDRLSFAEHFIEDFTRGSASVRVLDRIFRLIGIRFADQPAASRVKDWLVTLREQRNYPWKQAAADAMGVGANDITWIENGQGRLSTLCKAMRFYDVSLALVEVGDRPKDLVEPPVDAVAKASTAKVVAAPSNSAGARSIFEETKMLSMTDLGIDEPFTDEDISDDARWLGKTMWDIGERILGPASFGKIRDNGEGAQLRRGYMTVNNLSIVFTSFRLRFADQPPDLTLKTWVRSLVGEGGSTAETRWSDILRKEQPDLLRTGVAGITTLCRVLRASGSCMDIIGEADGKTTVHRFPAGTVAEERLTVPMTSVPQNIVSPPVASNPAPTRRIKLRETNNDMLLSIDWNPIQGMALHVDAMREPLSWEGSKIAYVGDIFRPNIPAMFIAQVLGIAQACPQHTFLFATDHLDRVAEMNPSIIWMPNMWVGSEVDFGVGMTGDEVMAEHRRITEGAAHLARIDAPIRFLEVSYVLTGPLNIPLDQIDWLLVADATREENAKTAKYEALRARCEERGIPFYFKGWLGRRTLNGKLRTDMPE